VKPIDLLLSKLLYNALLIFVFELIIYIEMSLFFGIEIKDKTSFLLTLFFGGMGMSNLFTLLSAITAKTGNVVLLAVLGFPIILPLLLLVLRLTGILDVALLEGDINVNLGAVIVLDMITMVMAIVLFPYLWKD
jgi:heme exporter protein B